MMELNLDVIDVLLKGGVSGMGAFFLYRITSIEKAIKALNDSVSVLNVNVARYMERSDHLEKRISRLEENK